MRHREPHATPHPRPLAKLTALLLSGAAATGDAAAARGVERSGAIALYDFRDAGGTTVHDRSGVLPPLDLEIRDRKAVRRSRGKLELRRATPIRSSGPATKISSAVRGSGAFSIEAWVRPSDSKQRGPARIVTLSRDTTRRNFTLGQEGSRYDVRFRTDKTSHNGLPSLPSKARTARDKPTHIVYSRARGGEARLYINGRLATSRKVSGRPSNWDDSWHLALGGEVNRTRPWRGTYYLVAIYARDLPAGEVARLFEAGPKATTRTTAPGTANNNLPAGPGTGPPRAIPVAQDGGGERRSPRGLQVLYDFEDAEGDLVRDRSGVGEPADLKISNPNAVRRTRGSLEIRGETSISTGRPASKVIESVRATGEISIEAWLRPADSRQDGPARIVTLSRDTNRRNFTLGQDGDRIDARLRTGRTSANGLPSLSTPPGSAAARLTHVVYTRDRNGAARLFVDGRQSAGGNVAGGLSNWDSGFHLCLGDEASGRRPWRGTYHLVAIYSRALSASEVLGNFSAGADAGTAAMLARAGAEENAELFHAEIAPLLAKHCLECHDSSTREGKLDLSRRDAALGADGHGGTIVPGSAADSPLWHAVANDEMPEDREPLSVREKALLKRWIDAGADWPLDVVDPSLYVRGTDAGRVFVRRLTVAEYIETVRATLGVDIGAAARELLPPDLRADGFSNTAYNLGVDLQHVDAYAQLAATIVGEMDVRGFAGRFSSKLKLKEKPMRALIESLGRWVLRGPLERHEVDSYQGVVTSVVAAGGGFEEAVGSVLEAMLQSPRFMYMIERQHGDGGPSPLGDYELASRMSYIIWGGPPDEELMHAAAQGELRDRGAAAKHVARMLEDPRARTRSAHFAAEWLDLDRLANLAPDQRRFPAWQPELAGDMRAETLAFFDEIAWVQRRPLADLFDAQFTFATPRLAEHYGLAAGAANPDPTGAEASPLGELSRYDLSGVPSRGGLLTQGSTLTVGGDEASMVARGLFILHDLLRGAVNDPPPGLDTTPVPAEPGYSQRRIAEIRVTDKSCGGCHAKFEPLAYGLERFDGLGAFHHTDEHGNDLREDGELLIPGAAEPVRYGSSAELMGLLADSDRVRETITWKLTQFALGRPLGGRDAQGVRAIHEEAQAAGGRYTDLVTAIVLSELARTTPTESTTR